MKKFPGKTLAGKVVSVHSGNNQDLSKEARESLTAEIGGFAGDKHQGFIRKAWDGEWEPADTLRRNERQWSGLSVEELAYISEHLALTEPLARRRGVIGVVDVPGTIKPGDEVEVRVYQQPAIAML